MTARAVLEDVRPPSEVVAGAAAVADAPARLPKTVATAGTASGIVFDKVCVAYGRHTRHRVVKPFGRTGGDHAADRPLRFRQDDRIAGRCRIRPPSERPYLHRRSRRDRSAAPSAL